MNTDSGEQRHNEIKLIEYMHSEFNLFSLSARVY